MRETKVSEYVLAYSETVDGEKGIEAVVNSFLNQGYELYGDLKIVITKDEAEDDFYQFYQPMIKKETIY
jgi:hypothetical protein